MSLYDGHKDTQKNKKKEKMKKGVMKSIIIVGFLIIITIALILYIQTLPNPLIIKLNGEANKELLKLIQIEKGAEGVVKLDSNKQPIIHAPIKEIARYFGYDGNNGNYMTVSEDTNSCNVRNLNEVSIFNNDSDVIYKKDLTNENSNYEIYKIKEKVFEYNNKLYTNKEGLEKAFNIYIAYDSNKNIIDIYTLDFYINYYSIEEIKSKKTGEETTRILEYGYSKIDEKYINRRAILDGMIVVVDEKNEYGAIDLQGEKIFSTQYDSLTYIPESEAFLIEKSSKYGIITSKGETKIEPVYSSLQLIDRNRQLYLASENNKYGVIDINGKIIVPLDFNKIGINLSLFAENKLTNAYIIQDTLIPVQQDQKWGFYDLSGKLVGEGIVYKNVGCETKNNMLTTYNVLSIPEYKSIVVCKSNKYGCIGLDGEQTVAFIADDVYMQISAGETKYIMSQTKNQQTYTKNIAELIK